MSENGSESVWEKTRFFSFVSTREMVTTWVGLIVTAFFFPLVAALWVIGGVIYYRVKFQGEHGGL